MDIYWHVTVDVMMFQLLDGNLGGEDEDDYDERRRKRPSLLGKPVYF